MTTKPSVNETSLLEYVGMLILVILGLGALSAALRSDTAQEIINDKKLPSLSTNLVDLADQIASGAQRR